MENVDTGVQCPWNVMFTASNILICKQYLFFHIHSPLNIPSISYICFLFFSKCLWGFYCDLTRFHIKQIYFFFLIYANIFLNCTYSSIHKNTNAYEVFQLTASNIFVNHFFLHIYNPFSIPCLTVIFVFGKWLWSFNTILIHFTLNFVHTCVHIQNTNTHKVLTASNILHL